jgi:hypothetical protein
VLGDASTNKGAFAADLLQVQPMATIGSINDCRRRNIEGTAFDNSVWIDSLGSPA